MKIFLLAVLLFVVGCSNGEEPEVEENVLEDLLGDWHGTIEVPEVPLNIQVSFEEEEDEEIIGFISIPVQGIDRYPLSDLEVEEEVVSFEMDIPGQFIEFEGELTENETFEGDFNQQGHTFDFKLERGLLAEEDDQEGINWLTVDTEFGPLQGELLEPEGEDTNTVALIIPGSGPTDRNGNAPGMENDSLKMVAETLAEQNVASLRYSKRGAGENSEVTIPEEELAIEDLVEDAVKWLQKLDGKEQYDEVIVVGHSQGVLIGSLAALQLDVDGLISLAGAGRPMDEVLHDQLEGQLTGDLLEEAEMIIESLVDGEYVEEVSSELYSLFRPTVQPFLATWFTYNPTDIATSINVPTLIVQGTHDTQVFVEDAENLAESYPNNDLVIVDGMNHVLKDSASPDDMSSYADPSIPLSEELVEEINQFIERLSP
ncbi:pimeloyl-ACP methyl ester carboxylesterase [Alkalibacillus filiformis]|uniref:Pimeloyl-ACP methyl ester carboxylesterase n=1 Tax=Alkalibacillus filiformis TaxID=200990 RepID=A0ABU0DUW9_9BACI|nr:alpha/beta hydrolase [Alkalibacillus filiformis]MDQ0352076.1 pimeloyl-ACP methyl ester carboxylesterase [Alkalibacillus filiformis]